jgi:hypothetical protein
LTAEFDNYRKRIDRERREATERAAEGVLGDVLPILTTWSARSPPIPARRRPSRHRRGVS